MYNHINSLYYINIYIYITLNYIIINLKLINIYIYITLNYIIINLRLIIILKLKQWYCYHIYCI